MAQVVAGRDGRHLLLVGAHLAQLLAHHRLRSGQVDVGPLGQLVNHPIPLAALAGRAHPAADLVGDGTSRRCRRFRLRLGLLLGVCRGGALQRRVDLDREIEHALPLPAANPCRQRHINPGAAVWQQREGATAQDVVLAAVRVPDLNVDHDPVAGLHVGLECAIPPAKRQRGVAQIRRLGHLLALDLEHHVWIAPAPRIGVGEVARLHVREGDLACGAAHLCGFVSAALRNWRRGGIVLFSHARPIEP